MALLGWDPPQPQTYLQDAIQGRVLPFLGQVGTGGASKRNVSIVGEDINSSWDGYHGPLRGLGGWASQSSLLSPVAVVDTTDPLCSFYMDFLLSQPCCGTIAQAGIYTGSFFGSISDHRPVVLRLTFWESAEPTHPTAHALIRPAVRGPELDLTNPELVAAYQGHLLTFIPPTAPRGLDARDALLQLSLASANWLVTRLAQHRPAPPSTAHPR